ncbi:MAG: hypothetical protein ACYDA4_10675 [Ignavibacteriaceae bacterium]
MIVLSFDSCSQTYSSLTNINFRIDFYSGGGFTGVESGITISSQGWAKYWKKNLNSLRQTTDSVAIPSDKMVRITNLMTNPKIFSYDNNYSGNYTTYLVLTQDIQFNQISFNESELPSNMPDVIKDLISEIKTINK